MNGLLFALIFVVFFILFDIFILQSLDKKISRTVLLVKGQEVVLSRSKIKSFFGYGILALIVLIPLITIIFNVFKSGVGAIIFFGAIGLLLFTLFTKEANIGLKPLFGNKELIKIDESGITSFELDTFICWDDIKKIVIFRCNTRMREPYKKYIGIEFINKEKYDLQTINKTPKLPRRYENYHIRIPISGIETVDLHLVEIINFYSGKENLAVVGF